MKCEKGRKGLLCVLLCLCIGIMVFAGYKMWESQREYAIGQDSYERIISRVVESVNDPSSSVQTPRRQIDFEELRSINKDVVGWIYCPGTEIDYPIAQGVDNVYYLDHTFERKWNKVGGIFLDYRNSPDFRDKSSILYGHHMRNGSMFAGIEGYKEQAYYDKHPVMYLYTPKEEYTIELFAGYVNEATDIYVGFENEIAFSEFVDELKRKSTFQTDVEVENSDRVLMLSTCVYDFKNARYVLAGKLTQGIN